MIKLIKLRMNNGLLNRPARYCVTEGQPSFSWAVLSERPNAFQAAYHIRVRNEKETFWESGWVETNAQQAAYSGAELPSDEKLFVRVSVRDDAGETAESAEQSFYTSGIGQHVPGWIAAPEDQPGHAVYFQRDFPLRGPVRLAILYACGLGYHQIFLNGERLDNSCIDPAFSDYTKSCYYAVMPDIQGFLRAGDNCLGIVLGEGWRRNEGEYLKMIGNKKIPFFGQPQLSAALVIEYMNGQKEVVSTDDSWLCGSGPIVENNLFNGETYDAGKTFAGWNLPGERPEGFQQAVKFPGPGGVARTMTLEPIVPHEVYEPKTITLIGADTVIVDFGQNIAGICRVRLPAGMGKGQKIVLEHMEHLDENGDLYLPNLRGARCRDVYVAAGDGRDLEFWQPEFTYHGFRYARVTGYPLLEKQDIWAISLYTDVAADSFFSCGSALVNAIQKNVVLTEKSNIMGILTDCPQRDERMGWMNDATVRFEETPYNFDIGRLFPKVVRDILDTQSPDGAITCTAPFIYGSRPADPVCSSFLIAGLETYLYSGDTELLQQSFDSFARWEDYLTGRSEGHLIPYSYYGDWAGPAYACRGYGSGLDTAYSEETPGNFMSTGYYYFNAVLLARFARILDKPAEQERYAALAADIKDAMLRKWWDGETGKMATGSQGCQCFALWLDIIPKEKRSLAASRIHDDLVERDYRFTTGNLCTRYLMDVLAANGYIDDAWRLITSEEYPSFGYEIQNEATTIWERFELKKNPGMNSYSHPMHGAVGYWLYAYIAGIKPMEAGFSEVDIHPYFPKKLLSAQAKVDTIKGDLVVRWIKRYGKIHLYINVPFGVRARVFFNNKEFWVGSGFYRYEAPLDETGQTAC